MIALNRAFVNDALKPNIPIEATPVLTGQHGLSASFGSFSDVLAGVQSESLNLQNGSDTSLATQFQNRTTFQSNTSDGTFGNESTNSNSASPTPAQPEAARLASAYKSSSAQPAENASNGEATGKHQVEHRCVQEPIHSDQAKNALLPNVDAKAVEKPKRPNGNAAAHQAVNLQTGLTAATSSSAGTPVEEEGSAGTTNSNVVAADKVEPALVSATRPRNPKAGESSADLAFALKIQGSVTTGVTVVTPANTTPTSADTTGLNTPNQASEFAGQLTSMLPFAALKPAQNAGTPNESLAGGLALEASVSNTGGSPGVSDETQEASQTEEAAPVAAIPDEPPASVQAIKTIQVQITGKDDQRVDLKLIEKSGALTMSVRSADGSLTKTLQQNLPELASKLDDQQIQAEWWRPDTHQPDTPQKESAQPSRESAGNGNEPGRQNQNPGQQGGRGTPKPDWVEELSSPRKSNQNGTQYIWQV